jgi:hypothetical protein
MQAALEAAAGGKVAAVAASAAAVAGGGYATVEHTVLREGNNRPAKVAEHQPVQSRNATVSSKHTIAAPVGASSSRPRQPTRQVDEFGQSRATANSTAQTEFGAPQQRAKSVRVISAAATTAPKPRQSAPSPTSKVAPEFGSTGGRDEFGP